MGDYFSDRENGPRPRTAQVISPAVWAGLVGLVRSLVNDGSFGCRFPKRCPDGDVVCGTDEDSLAGVIEAEMPGLAWPLETRTRTDDSFSSYESFAPDTLLILDFLEFVSRSVGRPLQGKYHDYYSHYHLGYDEEGGRAKFCADINRMFARAGVVYEFGVNGEIVRVSLPVLGDELRNMTFRTGERILDVMLEESRTKFSSPNPLIRREALERLWDAWERLKSMADADKRKSITMILDRAASEQTFRALLESEARLLTEVGNGRLIRHSEVSQIPIIDTDHVDYLFHRLFAMIQLLIRANSPG